MLWLLGKVYLVTKCNYAIFSVTIFIPIIQIKQDVHLNCVLKVFFAKNVKLLPENLNRVSKDSFYLYTILIDHK